MMVERGDAVGGAELLEKFSVVEFTDDVGWTPMRSNSWSMLWRIVVFAAGAGEGHRCSDFGESVLMLFATAL